MIVGYTSTPMAHHVRTEHAVALVVRSKDPVALAFPSQARRDRVRETRAVKDGCSRLCHEKARTGKLAITCSPRYTMLFGNIITVYVLI